MITFQLNTNNPDFNVLTFSFDGSLDPAALADIEADLNMLIDWIDFSKGFIVSGRGPVWLYGLSSITCTLLAGSLLMIPG